MDDEIEIIKVVVSQDVVFLYEKKISLKGNFKNYFIIYINCIFFFFFVERYNLKEFIVPLVDIFADIKPVPSKSPVIA
jgi:hypothetical protein